MFGRVVSDKARPFSGRAATFFLVYIYKNLSGSASEPPRLTPDELLIPPMITNQQGWFRGYFRPVVHADLRVGDVLPVHCFQRVGSEAEEYYNEDFQRLPGRTEPCGPRGLAPVFYIEGCVSLALTGTKPDRSEFSE